MSEQEFNSFKQTKTRLPAADGEHKGSPSVRFARKRRSHAVGSQGPKGEHGPWVPPGVEAWTGALLLSRLLTLGCVPIQASSGAHERAPPPRSPLGRTSLQPAVGGDSPLSSMPCCAVRPWCTALRSPRPARSRDARVWVPLPSRPLRWRGRAQMLGGQFSQTHLQTNIARTWANALPFRSALIQIWADASEKKVQGYPESRSP